MTTRVIYSIVLVILATSIAGCKTQSARAVPVNGASSSDPAGSTAFTLQTGVVDGRMVFIGVGGDIDAQVNPDLTVHPGDTVRITVINADGMSHDLVIPDLDVASATMQSRGSSVEVEFSIKDSQSGTYAYFCSIAGHRQAGMEGSLIVR